MANRHSKVLKVIVTLSSFIVLLLFSLRPIEAQIGLTYGWEGNNLPSKQKVVEIYKNYGIGRMRIYYPDHEILPAVKDSDIKLFLDVPNDQIQNFAQNSDLAFQWVKQNVVPYASAINYLAVGNELPQYLKQYVGPALQNTLNALRSTNSLADHIKVTTAIGMSEIKVSYPPSAGEFNDLAFMVPIANFLKQNGSPLMLNIYPYFTYIDNPGIISLDYALFTSSETNTDPNNGLQYHNVYDAQIDSVHAALARLDVTNSNGAPNTPIVTSESGFPDAGGDKASRDHASTYYNNLVNHARIGTPLRPGPTEVYLFSAFDENEKQGDAVEQHFGVLYPNGDLKYPGIDFRA